LSGLSDLKGISATRVYPRRMSRVGGVLALSRRSVPVVFVSMASLRNLTPRNSEPLERRLQRTGSRPSLGLRFGASCAWRRSSCREHVRVPSSRILRAAHFSTFPPTGPGSGAQSAILRNRLGGPRAVCRPDTNVMNPDTRRVGGAKSVAKTVLHSWHGPCGEKPRACNLTVSYDAISSCARDRKNSAELSRDRKCRRSGRRTASSRRLLPMARTYTRRHICRPSLPPRFGRAI
jgi:hypothetical protein